LVLCASASPASAAYLHSDAVSASFGPDGTPSTHFGYGASVLAIDQGDQHLYVLDRTAQGQEPITLYGFGLAAPHTPLGGNFPIFLPQGSDGNAPRSVAVDDTSLPSAGHFFYTEVNQGAGVLHGFDSTGESLHGEFPLELGDPMSPCGAAVDSEGHVWVADKKSKKIKEYSSEGVPLGGQINTGLSEPCSFVFNKKNDDIYVSGRNPASQIGAFLIWRFSAASNYQSIDEIDPNNGGGLEFDSKHQVLYVSRGQIAAFNPDGVPLENFAPGAQGMAIDESTGTVYVLDGAYNPLAEEFEVFVKVHPAVGVVPAVETLGAVGNTVQASVDPEGGGDVTSCSFEYGTTTSYGNLGNPNPPCTPSTPYSSPKAVSAQLPGLEPEVLYHYRARATNAAGTYVGVDRTFIPHHVQDLKTEDVTGVGKTGVTLNASYTGTEADTHFYFEWGTDSSYGNVTVLAPGADDGVHSGPRTISANVSGLQPETSYHYRVVASNVGGTSKGEDRTFKTATAVSDLAASITNLTGGSATLNGNWTGDGTDTHFYFEWGVSNVYGNASAEPPPGADFGTGTGPQHVTFDLTELLPTTTYHYRLVASNTTGTTATADQIFKTPQLPGIAYTPVLKLATTSAQLWGTVNPHGTGDTTYHFEYGPDTTYGASSPNATIVSDNVAHAVSLEVEALHPGTTYHYRLVATSPTGTAIGPDQTLTTVPNAPTVMESSVSGVTVSAATLHAIVSPGFGPTAVYFQYGRDQSYGLTTAPAPPLPADDSSHPVSTAVDALQADTTYHFRAVAVNFGNVSYGRDTEFTTPGVPGLFEISVTGVGQTTARLTANVQPHFSPTSAHFEYGPTDAYGSSTAESPILGADGTSHPTTGELTGLTPSTTYHYRLIATNSIGSVASVDGTFTTVPVPAPEQVPLKCKKGFRKKHGKCVRRKPSKTKKRTHRHTSKHA
jgi:phosphodiesterase/alkaline phosphatase D-like protein